MKIINKEEVTKALKKMENNREADSGVILSETWKALQKKGVEILLKVVNSIFEAKRMARSCQLSTLISIFKKNATFKIVITAGNPTDVAKN